jgi:hypothetical protein
MRSVAPKQGVIWLEDCKEPVEPHGADHIAEVRRESDKHHLPSDRLAAASQVEAGSKPNARDRRDGRKVEHDPGRPRGRSLDRPPNDPREFRSLVLTEGRTADPHHQRGAVPLDKGGRKSETREGAGRTGGCGDVAHVPQVGATVRDLAHQAATSRVDGPVLRVVWFSRPTRVVRRRADNASRRISAPPWWTAPRPSPHP